MSFGRGLCPCCLQNLAGLPTGYRLVVDGRVRLLASAAFPQCPGVDRGKANLLDQTRHHHLGVLIIPAPMMPIFMLFSTEEREARRTRFSTASYRRTSVPLAAAGRKAFVEVLIGCGAYGANYRDPGAACRAIGRAAGAPDRTKEPEVAVTRPEEYFPIRQVTARGELGQSRNLLVVQPGKGDPPRFLFNHGCFSPR